MSEKDPPAEKSVPLTREEELARKAAQFLKASKPQLRRFIETTRPRAEQAGRDAARFAREHESELKDAATKIALSRFTGPLGMAANSLAQQMKTPAPGAQPESTVTPGLCASCGTANHAAAKFCNECGQKLQPPATAE